MCRHRVILEVRDLIITELISLSLECKPHDYFTEKIVEVRSPLHHGLRPRELFVRGYNRKSVIGTPNSILTAQHSLV